MKNAKLIWNTPSLAQYGNVSDITTGNVECKQLGAGDDLAEVISTTTGCVPDNDV